MYFSPGTPVHLPQEMIRIRINIVEKVTTAVAKIV